MVGDGTQRLAPVFADDVAKVVAAIDDRRDPIEGVWSIGRAGGRSRRTRCSRSRGRAESRRISTRRRPRERLSALLEIPVSIRATELFAADSVADAPDAGSVFGVSTMPFEEGLRAIATKVAAEGTEGH